MLVLTSRDQGYVGVNKSLLFIPISITEIINEDAPSDFSGKNIKENLII